MNVKEYLMTNSSPLLDNPKNILILEWLEANSFCSPIEISTRINLPIQEINEIIQILYKNNLITFCNNKYKITTNGIKLLDKLGLSDLQITSLMGKTDFQEEEYSIYKSIFHEWRSNFLDIYLFISYTLENEYNDICMSFSDFILSPKTGHSILIASLFHNFAQILYTEENSNLMKYYNDLFEYSFMNHCVSSELYHTTSKYWSPNEKHVQLISNFHNSLNLFCETSIHTFIFPEKYEIGNINNDFSISYNLITDPKLLSKIFISQNLDELSKKFNWTEQQTKFFLKSIRSKVDTLLQTGETNETVSSFM